MKFKIIFALFCCLGWRLGFAADTATIRIAVQAQGTVAWELAALESPPSSDFKLEITSVANAQAGKIALQSGTVDMIVSDWVWVSSLRASGTDFTFYPYSSTSGALIVPDDSAIHSIQDLKGKRLGVAGGELDKNWLLLMALAQKQGLDLNADVEKSYGAPPLINEQLKLKRVDAALTYWNFAARLEGQGYRQVLNGKDILKGLGVTEQVPAIGYVFKESWAKSHKQALTSFLKAVKQARAELCGNDSAWQKVLPLVQAENAATQSRFRQGYCEGGIAQFGEKERQAMERIYTLVRTLSKNQLTGSSEHLSPGTFWSLD